MVVDLAALQVLLPQLKGVTGTVTVEGGLEGCLARPKELKPQLSIALDKVGLRYAGADGKDVPVEAGGSLSVTRDLVSLKGFGLTVGGESLSAAADIREPLGMPSGTLTVSGGAFDLDKLIALKPKAAPSPGAGPASSAPPKPISMDLLREQLKQADLAIAIQMKEIVWKGNKLSALDVKASNRKGVLEFMTMATVNEGPVKIALSLDTTQKEVPFAASIEAKDIKLDVELPEIRFVLPILAGGQIHGKASLSPVRLEGRGRDWEGILNTLHTVEDGRLTVGEGTLKGSTVFNLLGDVLRQPALKTIQFDSIESRFSVKDRQVNNLGTVVHSSAGNISTRGWVYFDTRLEQKAVLDGDFLKTGHGEQADQVMEIVMGKGGILVEGTVAAPKTHLDTNAIMKEVGKEIAKRLLEQQLKDQAKEGLGKALEGLFGR